MPRRRTEPRRHPRRDDDLRRRPPTKQGRAIILIVCEGVESELNDCMSGILIGNKTAFQTHPHLSSGSFAD